MPVAEFEKPGKSGQLASEAAPPGQPSAASGALDPGDRRPEVREALRSWLRLQWALALDPARATELLTAARDPDLALRAVRDAPAVCDSELDAGLARLARARVVGVPYLSPAYPHPLSLLRDAAPLLWVRGRVEVLHAPSVAIIGARAPSAYGLAVAHQLAADLARAGPVIVSGLARGIDAAAHRGALDAGGLSVAIQACGPDRVYPRAHRALSDEIAARGAVVSELPPGTPPRPPHFPLRNRLISGLVSALVVVEARERSGSLITVRHALDQGVDVFAVPGPVVSPTSAGTNRLLRDGALVALGAEDVLLALGWTGAATRRRRAGRVELSAEARAIVAALDAAPATRDELARRFETAPERLALALFELEIEHRVREDRDGRLRVVSPARGPEL